MNSLEISNARKFAINTRNVKSIDARIYAAQRGEVMPIQLVITCACLSAIRPSLVDIIRAMTFAILTLVSLVKFTHVSRFTALVVLPNVIHL